MQKIKVGTKVRVIKCLSDDKEHEGQVGKILSVRSEDSGRVRLADGDWCNALKVSVS